MDFRDVGVICLNLDAKGGCPGCLWLEWDTQRQCCCNGLSPICALYRQELLFSHCFATPASPFNRLTPATPAAAAGSASPPGAAVLAIETF
jgi:hypothetical protein